MLVVVGDVWQRGDIRPLEGLGGGSALLITTRNRDTLPPNTQPLDVDQMEPSEAVRLLGAGLGGYPEEFGPLARQLGEWPLLLRLVNGQLRKLTSRGVNVDDALDRVAAKLRERGLSAFDRRNAEAREDAVGLTMAAGFESGILVKDDQARFHSLAIFPEDTDIPVEVLAPYWDLDFDDAAELAEQLFDLSLLQHFDVGPQSLRLHDVFRHYLIGEQYPQLVELNRKFLEVNLPESGHWADLPESVQYLWRNFAYHQIEAHQESVLASTLFDFSFLRAKLETLDVNSLLDDYSRAPKHPGLGAIAGALRISAHVLSRHTGQLAGQLLGRLQEVGDPDLQPFLRQVRRVSGLKPRRGTLTPPGGPLLRTLTGHTGEILAAKIIGKDRLVSASEDRTLRVWDIKTGDCQLVLEGHSFAVDAIESLGGSQIVTASRDTTLRIWDITSGECIHDLVGHTDWVTVVKRLDDGRVASGSDDNSIRVWDTDLGRCLQIFRGHTSGILAIDRLQGNRIVSASRDKELRVWDIETGDWAGGRDRGHPRQATRQRRQTGRHFGWIAPA